MSKFFCLTLLLCFVFVGCKNRLSPVEKSTCVCDSTAELHPNASKTDNNVDVGDKTCIIPLSTENLNGLVGIWGTLDDITFWEFNNDSVYWSCDDMLRSYQYFVYGDTLCFENNSEKLLYKVFYKGDTLFSKRIFGDYNIDKDINYTPMLRCNQTDFE